MEQVSIITPAFNSREFIADTYASLEAQSVRDWKWIVVDDCSTDGTRDILDGLAGRDDRIDVILNKENSGAAFSRNEGLKASHGDFVAFLDADDLWRTEKLSRQLQFMRENGVDASFTAYAIVDESGQKLGKTIDEEPRGVIDYVGALRKRATMGCSTVMLRRKSIGDALMPPIRTGQDYAYWLLLMRKGLEFHHFPEALSEYRVRPGSISRNKFKKARRQWQIYRELEGLGLITSAVSFASYAYRALTR